MGNKLEQLLNSLIEKGWKVFGVEPNGRKVTLTKRVDGRIHISYFDETIGRTGGRDFSLRELVSKESGLWQFVCENLLSKMNSILGNGNYGGGEEYTRWDYQYRLIESALCNEDELEDFLIQNIKIDG